MRRATSAGRAKNIRFISGESTVFDDAKVTTCKRDDEAWFIKMNELEIDEYDQTAAGTNASAHFMGVPSSAPRGSPSP